MGLIHLGFVFGARQSVRQKTDFNKRLASLKNSFTLSEGKKGEMSSISYIYRRISDNLYKSNHITTCSQMSTTWSYLRSFVHKMLLK